MAIFDYKVKDREGTTLTGQVVAPGESVAYEILKEKNYIIVSLREKRRIVFPGLKSILAKKIKSRDVVIFARQLATMISANVPIVRALRVLVRQTKSPAFKTVISDLGDEVDGGAKLSVAMSRYPRVFSNFFTQMVRSAETTGRLDEILNYLANQIEKDYDLMAKVRGALMYPAFIVVGIIAVAVAMMIFVFPQLLSVLQEGGAKLPFTTQALITTSNLLRNFWWAILLLVLVLVIFFRFYKKTPIGQKQIDLLKIHIPVFGEIFQKTYLTRFTQCLATLITSGVPLARSLEIVADVVGNSIYRDLTLETIKEVEAGNSITTVFAESKNVPLMLSQMMSVGEQSGKLDRILYKLSDFYARELENLLKNLVSLIEPIIMVLLGFAVAILVSAIILPIYNLSSSI